MQGSTIPRKQNKFDFIRFWRNKVMLKMKFSPKRPGVLKTSQDKIQYPQAWNSGNFAREFPAFTGIRSK